MVQIAYIALILKKKRNPIAIHADELWRPKAFDQNRIVNSSARDLRSRDEVSTQ